MPTLASLDLFFICMLPSVREPQATRQAQMSFDARCLGGQANTASTQRHDERGDSALRAQRRVAASTCDCMRPGDPSPSVRWLPEDRQPTPTVNRGPPHSSTPRRTGA